MPDYANGKIYCIRSLTDNDRIVYIGSTIRPLSERMSAHRKAIVQKSNTKFYKLMAEVGVEHFHIELITNFPCETKEQLVAEEGRHIRLNDTINNGVNSNMAGRSPRQYEADNRDARLEKSKAYTATHKVEINARSHEYYQRHAEQIKAYQVEYYQRHAEQIKATRDDNKMEKVEKNKAYRAAHKVEINARRVARRAELKRLAEAAAPVEA